MGAMEGTLESSQGVDDKYGKAYRYRNKEMVPALRGVYPATAWWLLFSLRPCISQSI